MKVLIVVTHLLGSGHLSRALTLAREFADSGHEVHVASGGMPVAHLPPPPGVRFCQLPPLRSDGTNFTHLLNETGGKANASLLTARTQKLLSLLEKSTPDILITELFPFGRRILADEFLTLLNAAKTRAAPPVILSSIRDILAPPSSAKKAAKTEEIIRKYYDTVLVHADKTVTPLDLSWPVSTDLRPFLHYTGFVTPPPPMPHPNRLGTHEVLVTAGGGGVGDALFATACAAAALDRSRPWRALIGGQNAAQRITDLRTRFADSPIHLEPVRPDFRQMLCHAAASVSMCGYNTALDLLQTGLPSVVVPFDDGQEVEQSLRGSALSKLPGFSMLRSPDLTPDILLRALDTVCSDAPRDTARFGFDGAAQSVGFATALAEART